jgi:hypothetical protein
MIDEKELVARAEALDLSQKIRPQPQSVKVYVTCATALVDREVPLTLAYQGGTQLTPGQLKIRNVVMELEREIMDSLNRASHKLRNVALQPWVSEK